MATPKERKPKVPVIRVTKDYGLFTFTDENRVISTAHVNKVGREVDRKNLSQDSPIKVKPLDDKYGESSQHDIDVLFVSNIFSLFGELSFPSTVGPFNLELSAFLSFNGRLVPKNVFTSFSFAKSYIFSFLRWSKHIPSYIPIGVVVL